jgi:hypothetical protein
MFKHNFSPFEKISWTYSIAFSNCLLCSSGMLLISIADTEYSFRMTGSFTSTFFFYFLPTSLPVFIRDTNLSQLKRLILTLWLNS